MSWVKANLASRALKLVVPRVSASARCAAAAHAYCRPKIPHTAGCELLNADARAVGGVLVARGRGWGFGGQGAAAVLQELEAHRLAAQPPPPPLPAPKLAALATDRMEHGAAPPPPSPCDVRTTLAAPLGSRPAKRHIPTTQGCAYTCKSLTTRGRHSSGCAHQVEQQLRHGPVAGVAVGVVLVIVERLAPQRVVGGGVVLVVPPRRVDQEPRRAGLPVPGSRRQGRQPARVGSTAAGPLAGCSQLVGVSGAPGEHVRSPCRLCSPRPGPAPPPQAPLPQAHLWHAALTDTCGMP
jgi:hypothetical protein